jgi:hypothetical protein
MRELEVLWTEVYEFTARVAIDSEPNLAANSIALSRSQAAEYLRGSYGGFLVPFMELQRKTGAHQSMTDNDLQECFAEVLPPTH